MICNLEVTRDSLREDLDRSINYVERALEGFGEPIPPSARKCLSVDVILACVALVYTADAAELRKALDRLRSTKEDLCREGFPEPTAAALARAIIELDPIFAEFPDGYLDRLTRRGKPLSRLIPPILVPVRGVDKIAAERRITWLLTKFGVPAGGRQESPSEAMERRAA